MKFNKPVLNPALWSQQPHAMLQVWGRVSGKLCGRKGSGGVGQLLTEHESAVLNPGEAIPQVLCLVLGPSLQEIHQGPGACSVKGNKAGEGSEAQVLRGAAEGTEIV